MHPINAKKNGKHCHSISEELRKRLFDDYYSLGNITRQREFLIRHMTKQDTKRRTVKGSESRRTCTVNYFLTIDGIRFTVCKKMFLNILGISERTARTALCKTSDLGILEKERRGGRQRSQKVLEEEENIRIRVSEHIDRYPKMESHYCRVRSSRLYLHPDFVYKENVRHVY